MLQHSTACAFPGQGIQKPGMATLLQNTSAWRLFTEASDILGYDLGQLCVWGPEEQLNNTAYAQVAIFVTCYALWDVYQEHYEPKIFLGHSLGEVTALAAAGAFTFADGVRLVQARGRAMAKDGLQGGMAAVLGLELEKIQELCERVSLQSYVAVANENSPGQIVVSGEWQALEHFTVLAQEHGAKRVVRLNVSGPFHSKLMEPAAEEFRAVVEELPLASCHTPVLSNDGKTLLLLPEEIRTKLVAQITQPVRFTSSVQRLFELGVTKFVEVSPEGILIPLAKRSQANLQFTLVRDGGM